ncbi:MAG TPA: cyclodeaminase/cyclohydrolase family protein [Bryobacteraceae bacterium]|nr:cyclodeaminase/cyclohydrolase family protein [Bryobacteraceae bacterium]
MNSIWSRTLVSFQEGAAGTDPVPAGVSVASVTASFGLALLIKVLEIGSRRKNFAGDREQIRKLIEAARRESAQLAEASERDIAAFGPRMTRAMIEIPMSAARSAAAGLDLCAEAAGLVQEVVQGLVAADLGAAAAILHGALRAILLCVDFNLSRFRSDELFSEAIRAEKYTLQDRAEKQAKAVLARAAPSGGS